MPRIRRKPAILTLCLLGVLITLIWGLHHHDIQTLAAIPLTFKSTFIDPEQIQNECQNYFTELLERFPGDETTTYSNFGFEGETLESYFKLKREELFKENRVSVTDLARVRFLQENPITDDILDQWTEEYNWKVLKNNETITGLQQQMKDTRVFHTCWNHKWIHKGDAVDPTRLFARLEQKLFPWLSQKTGQDDHLNTTLRRLQDNSSGKGIVLTVSDQHMSDVFSLVISLRLHKTSLPLEIIYKDGELSDLSIAKIRLLSSIPITKDNINEIIANDKLSPPNPEQIGSRFQPPYPSLQVQFIDTNDFVSLKFQPLFRTFKNKIIATLFTSFSEFLLMDADVVLFQKPEFFFKLKQYEQHGAFLFRDRELPNRASALDKPFWTSLFPLPEEHQKFQIPLVDLEHPHITNNRYFNGFTHFVESGVVVFNKKRHLLPVLLSIQLQLWDVATRRVWGDKEFFWLSMLIAGNVGYTVNEHQCGAMGVEESIPQLSILEEEIGVCSVQLVHIYENQLMWMNSGFKYCKFSEVFPDEFRMRGKSLGMDEAQFKKFFFGAVTVRDVIVPPSIDDFYLNYDPMSQTERFSWRHTKRCRGYCYCAKQKVRVPGETREGVLLQVGEEDRRDLQVFGEVWVDGPLVMERLLNNSNYST